MLSTVRIQHRLYLLPFLFALGLFGSVWCALQMEASTLRAERISQLKAVTHLASGIFDQWRKRSVSGELTEADAKTRAVAELKDLRYGNGDYLAVLNDEDAIILAHPNPNYIGKPSPVPIAVEATKRAAKLGEAVVEYRAARAGSDAEIPKIGYFVDYAPWHWVVTTGVYVDDLNAVFWSAAEIAISIGSAVLLLLTGMTFLIIRSICSPLGALKSTMTAMSTGAIDITVPHLILRDEIGEMAQAVQVFKDAAIDKLRLETESEALRQKTEQERVREEAARQVVAEQQTFVVDSLAEGLSRLSKGDLTCDMGTPFAADYERLRTDFNAAVLELRGVIGTIVTNTGALKSGTTEISQAADDLSRRTEQQAASLEETAAALDEITATVRKTAEGANSAQTVVATAKADAERSEAVVRDAVTAMSAIEQSSREIGQIIGVIDEIAFQTNLLALNAGVEAARAGDAGRGFAVVASEVRALAQRSAQAAKEIKTLIGASTAQVGRGVTLVNETGTSLGRILTHVTQINGVVSEIAASAHEQASGLAQVNTAVNQMDQVTQQNAAMVEQSTAASHSLAQDTAELEKLTSRFNLGTQMSVKSHSPSPAIRRGAASKMPRVVAGSAARKEETWEEF